MGLSVIVPYGEGGSGGCTKIKQCRVKYCGPLYNGAITSCSSNAHQHDVGSDSSLRVAAIGAWSQYHKDSGFLCTELLLFLWRSSPIQVLGPSVIVISIGFVALGTMKQWGFVDKPPTDV